MYTTWPNLPALRAARWPLGGGTEISQGERRSGRGDGRGGDHGGLTDRDRKHLTGRINIGQDINKDDGRMTDDRAPGSGREKLGREITMEWY